MKMVQLIGSTRRLAALVAVALIGGAALLTLSVAPASAEIPTCEQAQFCLYVNADANGGIYRNDGSDVNLNNDRYEVHNLDIKVGNTARNAYNNGKPAFRDDVIIYAGTNYRGANDCIKRGEFGALPRNWWNNIESYRWVTDKECAAAGPPLDLGNHNIP
jgi:hypothetical protein